MFFVSIRARHCWRAMRTGTFRLFGNDSVSIRARHCWRAMHQQLRPMLGRGCFNPRPPLLAGDALQHWNHISLNQLFQSAPAIAGGRCPPSSRALACVPSCFNPRPPLLAGDALIIFGVRVTPSMFQSAPAIAGGRCPSLFPLFFFTNVVSIRARHCWRAMPCRLQ